MDRPVSAWSRRLGKSLPEIGDAVCWVADVAESARLGEEMSFAMQVCVEEVLTNIVRHGECPIGPGEIALDVTVAREGARIVVEDDCSPFDITKMDMPPPHNDPLDPEVGGWGVGLIRGFASGIAYQRIGDRNRLTLDFDRTPT